MSVKTSGPRLAGTALAVALGGALVLSLCPLQGIAYALEAGSSGDGAALEEPAEPGDGASPGDEAGADDPEAGSDEEPVDIADAAVLEDAGADAVATEDPIDQVEALGIATDPSEAEGYDPAADEEPGQDEGAPAGYDEYAGSDDEGVSAQSDGSVRVGDWSYRAEEDGGGQTVYVIDGYYGSDSSITLPATLGGKQMYSVRFGSTGLPSTVTSVTIPASIKEIGAAAFYSSKVTSVTFAANSQLTAIGRQAFAQSAIHEFTIPARVKTLGYQAFYNSRLTKLTLNTELEAMVHTENVWSGSDKYERTEHYNPCGGCGAVTFVVPSGCKNYKVENGALLSKDGSILYAQLSNLGGGTYTVPSGVKYIGAYAMSGNTTFSDIVLPQGLTTMEQYCLYSTNIRSLSMPDSVTHVQGYICRNCTSLQSVRISNSLEELGECAGWECFFGCSSLTSLTLGSKLRVIGNSCFAETRLTSVNLPASVQQLNYGAFGDIPTLKSVTGASGLRYIYSLAFRNAGITSFPFGKNLKFVSNNAFYNCKFTPSYPSYMEEQSDGYYSYDGKLAVRGDKSYSMAWQVLDLVNQERAKKGLSALTMDKDLLNAAMLRAAETSVCFSHTRPTGQTCFTASSKMTRENIASGTSTAQAVMNQWMNSSGHRANILSSDTKSIGIGCVKVTGRYFWVQCFGTSNAETVSKPANVSNQLLKVNYMEAGLKSFGSRFEVYPVSDDGLQIVGTEECLKQGESQRYALFTFPWGAEGRQVTLIDDSCIAWSLSGSGARQDGPTVTGVSKGTFTLTASVGNGTVSASMTRSMATDISGAKVEAASQTYTGATLYPDVKVTLNGTVLEESTDYYLSYEAGRNAGTVKLTVTGKGKYSGTATGTFTINPADASRATVKVADQAWTGKALTPSPTVTFGGKTLRQGTDYTVSYTNNVNPGTATATVTFKGNYKGSAKGSFKITKASSGSGGSNSSGGSSGSGNSGSSGSGGSNSGAATGRVTMTRLYNRWSGEHLYTSSAVEVKDLVGRGWRNEGTAWVAPSTSSTPVYRLYNPWTGDHHYTTSKKEYDDCAKQGWRKEGVAWYSADAKTGVPLYRGFNPYESVGTHHYTTDKGEMANMVKAGWRAEGIGWYGLK